MKYSDLHLVYDEGLGKSGWSQSLQLVACQENLSPLLYGVALSTVGPITVFWADDGLRYLGFDEERAYGKVLKFWPSASFLRDDFAAAVWIKKIEGIWHGKESEEPLVMAVSGTPFQMDVWKSLLKIPSGHVVSYGTVAKAVGKPDAVRAVGTAVGSNPISLLIPCHRVIQKNGSVKNYGWGDAMKQKILKAEAAC